MFFMGLVKAYDSVTSEALREVLVMRGREGGVLNTVKSFCAGSVACVRIDRVLGD